MSLAGSSIAAVVAEIHQRSLALTLAVTGGGSGAIGRLLEVPGGSRTVVEAIVPYSAEALANWLGGRPEHYCSRRTARAMAAAAFVRGEKLTPPDDARRRIGLGCTASLVSAAPKKGPHRIHVAAQTAGSTTTWSLELDKGARDRPAEESVAAGLILNALAETAGVVERVALDLSDTERIEVVATLARPDWSELLVGRVRAVRSDGATIPAVAAHHGARDETSPVIFPGAFNPRHFGHQRMADVAERLLGRRVAYEISILNVDKPPLDFTEWERRAAQFSPDEPLWFTRAATFVEKADLFPGATFIVGCDTVERIAEPRYYGGDAAAAERAVAHLAEQGCGFLVFGRVATDGFHTLDDLSLPDNLRRLCRGVPVEEFRADVSSTDIRRQGAWTD